MMATIIASAALIAILTWAIRYLIVHKRGGAACVGCSVEGACPVTALYGGSGQAEENIAGYSASHAGHAGIDAAAGRGNRKLLPVTPIRSAESGSAEHGKASGDTRRGRGCGCGC